MEIDGGLSKGTTAVVVVQLYKMLVRDLWAQPCFRIVKEVTKVLQLKREGQAVVNIVMEQSNTAHGPGISYFHNSCTEKRSWRGCRLRS